MKAIRIAKPASLSRRQNAIWSLEKRYWQYIKSLDRDQFISLWSEDFVAWPHPMPEPIGKSFIRTDPFALFRDRQIEEVQLEPKGINVWRSVAVAFYAVEITYREGDDHIDIDRFRISHTWRWTNRRWCIVGGMSAPSLTEMPSAN